MGGVKLKMFTYLYVIKTGEIFGKISGDQNIETLFKHSESDISEFGEFKLPQNIDDHHNYIYSNGKVIKMSEIEIYETRRFGKRLTDEERLLNQLKPSREEVKQAENTIEILSILQEVLE